MQIHKRPEMPAPIIVVTSQEALHYLTRFSFLYGHVTT